MFVLECQVCGKSWERCQCHWSRSSKADPSSNIRCPFCKEKITDEPEKDYDLQGTEQGLKYRGEKLCCMFYILNQEPFKYSIYSSYSYFNDINLRFLRLKEDLKFSTNVFCPLCPGDSKCFLIRYQEHTFFLCSQIENKFHVFLIPFCNLRLKTGIRDMPVNLYSPPVSPEPQPGAILRQEQSLAPSLEATPRRSSPRRPRVPISFQPPAVETATGGLDLAPFDAMLAACRLPSSMPPQSLEATPRLSSPRRPQVQRQPECHNPREHRSLWVTSRTKPSYCPECTGDIASFDLEEERTPPRPHKRSSLEDLPPCPRCKSADYVMYRVTSAPRDAKHGYICTQCGTTFSDLAAPSNPLAAGGGIRTSVGSAHPPLRRLLPRPTSLPSGAGSTQVHSATNQIKTSSKINCGCCGNPLKSIPEKGLRIHTHGRLEEYLFCPSCRSNWEQHRSSISNDRELEAWFDNRILSIVYSGGTFIRSDLAKYIKSGRSQSSAMPAGERVTKRPKGTQASMQPEVRRSPRRPQHGTEPHKRKEPVRNFQCCICLRAAFALIPPESRISSAFAEAFAKESFTEKYYLCQNHKQALMDSTLGSQQPEISRDPNSGLITKEDFLKWVSAVPDNEGLKRDSAVLGHAGQPELPSLPPQHSSLRGTSGPSTERTLSCPRCGAPLTGAAAGALGTLYVCYNCYPVVK